MTAEEAARAQADEHLALLVEERAHVPAPADGRCMKCQAWPDERCSNAHDEGGICIRRVA